MSIVDCGGAPIKGCAIRSFKEASRFAEHRTAGRPLKLVTPTLEFRPKAFHLVCVCKTEPLIPCPGSPRIQHTRPFTRTSRSRRCQLRARPGYSALTRPGTANSHSATVPAREFLEVPC
jgi:hypothetical protein